MRNIERLNLRTSIPVNFAVRSIAVSGIEEALTFHRNSRSISEKNSEAQRTRGFNSTGKFISSEFSVVYHQSTKVNSPELATVFLADCIVKILNFDTHPHAVEITGLILQLMRGHSVNCHEIYERYSSGDTTVRDIAVGNGEWRVSNTRSHKSLL